MIERSEFDYEKLEKLLEDRGVMKKWLGNKVGVRPAYFKDMKRLKRQPSIAVWLATSMVLSVPPEYFAKSK